MKQQVSATHVIVIVVAIVVALGGFFYVQNARNESAVKETAKQGEDVGKKMMERMQGRTFSDRP